MWEKQDKGMKHIICKYRIIADEFDFKQHVHVEISSLNTLAYLIIVKEKGNWGTAVY